MTQKRRLRKKHFSFLSSVLRKDWTQQQICLSWIFAEQETKVVS